MILPKNFIRSKTLKLSFRIKFLKVKKIFKDLSFFTLSIIQNKISQDFSYILYNDKIYFTIKLYLLSSLNIMYTIFKN